MQKIAFTSIFCYTKAVESMYKEMEMNTQMKKQIIFDMDGVLFDTENLVFSCWKFAAGKFMLTGIEDVFYQVIGVSSEGIFQNVWR